MLQNLHGSASQPHATASTGSRISRCRLGNNLKLEALGSSELDVFMKSCPVCTTIRVRGVSTGRPAGKSTVLRLYRHACPLTVGGRRPDVMVEIVTKALLFCVILRSERCETRDATSISRPAASSNATHQVIAANHAFLLRTSGGRPKLPRAAAR